MTDNKIGSGIRPIAEPRAPEKSQRKEPDSGAKFEQLLENAKSELQSLQTQSSVKTAPTDATAIQAQLDVEKQKFDAAMRAKQQLSQAYLDMKNKPAQDKG